MVFSISLMRARTLRCSEKRSVLDSRGRDGRFGFARGILNGIFLDGDGLVFRPAAGLRGIRRIAALPAAITVLTAAAAALFGLFGTRGRRGLHQAEIMFGMLCVILGTDMIPCGLGIPGQGRVFFVELLGIAAHPGTATAAFIAAIGVVAVLRRTPVAVAAAPARPSVTR